MPFFGLIRPLFRLGFWFDVRGTPFTPWADQLILALMLCLLLAAGATLWVRREARQAGMDKHTRRIWQRLFRLLLAGGLSGLVLYVFTWQRIPVFSMRIFYLVWLGGMIFGAYVLVRYALEEVPAIRARQAERIAHEKWLPKSKR